VHPVVGEHAFGGSGSEMESPGEKEKKLVRSDFIFLIVHCDAESPLLNQKQNIGIDAAAGVKKLIGMNQHAG